MPNTSKIDKKPPKKPKEGTVAPFIAEKKVKKSKTPKDEAEPAEEGRSSSKKVEKIYSEKMERRKRTAESEGSTLELNGSAQESKGSSGPTKESQMPEGTTQEPPITVSRSVKRKSAAQTSKNASGPPRSPKPVGVREENIPKQKKRTRGDDESMTLMSTIAKKLKLNDGGAAAPLSKVKEPPTKGITYSTKEEEEIMFEDSSGEEVEGEDYIHGFSTDEDSSDNDAMAAEVPALDISELPTITKDDTTVQKRLQRAKSKPVST
jgi:nucleolar protein 15